MIVLRDSLELLKYYSLTAHDKPVHPPTHPKQKLHKVPLHKDTIKVHAFDDETMEDETIRHVPIVSLKESDHVGHSHVDQLSAQVSFNITCVYRYLIEPFQLVLM